MNRLLTGGLDELVAKKDNAYVQSPLLSLIFERIYL